MVNGPTFTNIYMFSICKLRYFGLDLGVSQFLAILRAGSYPVGDKVVCAQQTITRTHKPNHISYLLTIKSHLNLVENQES